MRAKLLVYVGFTISLFIKAFVLLGNPLVSSVRSMTSFMDDKEIGVEIKSALDSHKKGDTDGALSLYEKLIPQTEGKVASSLSSNAGAILMQRGDFDGAHKHFVHAVDSDPKSAQAHFNLAVLLTTKLNKQARAIKHCSSAIQLDPRMYKAFHLMGNILQTIGRMDDAEAYFLQAETIARSGLGIISEPSSKLPPSTGWGELPIAKSLIGDIIQVDIGGRAYSMKCLSERPRIFCVKQLLTKEECTAVMERALHNGTFEKSFVMGGQITDDADESIAVKSGLGSPASDSDTAKKSDPYRLSHTMWLPADNLLSDIQLRLSTLTGLPLAYLRQQAEELQVVRYDGGGRFKTHQDSSAFHPRLLTALIYLSEPPSAGGGETWFPFAGHDRPFDLSLEEAISMSLQEDTRHTSSDVGAVRGGLLVTPAPGDAIVFFNHLSGGEIDASAVHAGLPVLESREGVVSDVGVTRDNFCEGYSSDQKWIANYWIGQNLQLLSDLIT